MKTERQKQLLIGQIRDLRARRDRALGLFQKTGNEAFKAVMAKTNSKLGEVERRLKKLG